jgi:hypothetical protein
VCVCVCVCVCPPEEGEILVIFISSNIVNYLRTSPNQHLRQIRVRVSFVHKLRYVRTLYYSTCMITSSEYYDVAAASGV